MPPRSAKQLATAIPSTMWWIFGNYEVAFCVLKQQPKDWKPGDPIP